MPYIIDDSSPNGSVRYDEQGAYPTVAAAWEALNDADPIEADEPDEFDDWGYPQSWEQHYSDMYNSDSYINYLNG